MFFREWQENVCAGLQKIISGDKMLAKGVSNMTLQHILFDLDGTLTDSMLGITNCAMYALEKFDIHPESREELLP